MKKILLLALFAFTLGIIPEAQAASRSISDQVKILAAKKKKQPRKPKKKKRKAIRAYQFGSATLHDLSHVSTIQTRMDSSGPFHSNHNSTQRA